MSGAFLFLAGRRGFAAMTLIICIAMLATAQCVPATNPTNAPIPFAELGAKAGAQYHGDGLSIQPAREGARLRCDFQKLEGEATAEGLWLTSTADGAHGDRFRVVAKSVGRVADGREENLGAPAFRRRVVVACWEKLVGETPALPRALAHTGTVAVVEKVARFVRPGLVEEYSVSVDGVRQDFVVVDRPGGEGKLRVELDVAGAKVVPLADGARPVRYAEQAENAELVKLSHGARPVRYPEQVGNAELVKSSHRARLVLENSGRTIAYSRLRVTDATGRELSARLEIPSPPSGERVRVRGQATCLKSCGLSCDVSKEASLMMNPNIQRTASPLTPALSPLRGEGETSGVSGANDAASASRAPTLAVVVEDSNAVYPVRIDPTFSDANWISMGSTPGTDGPVFAALVDGSGNLYIGGHFTVVGDVFAANIAKWNGSSWSALGSGMDSSVGALALSGNDLYAGGWFTTAGGSAANYIAKWNGSSWSGLGSGMGGGAGFVPAVGVLAVSGSDIYASGYFTTAGDSPANGIAKWNGTNWTALGSGVNGLVWALAVSGSDLYVGGSFTMAGGSAADKIAKWDGSSWSALGSGIGGDCIPGPGPGPGLVCPYVSALAVLGSNVYAGGFFTTAGSSTATNIAKWDGTNWSPMGLGIGGGVSLLAVSGSDVCAGGKLTTAGGSSTNDVARWDGSSWRTLGLGIGERVSLLAVSGSDVYAWGTFTTVGGTASNAVAKWNGSSWTALALASGFNGPVYSVVVLGTDLYVGGNFTVAGGSAANLIAKWNGSSWSALGSGMGGVSDGVHALAVSGGDVYAGGTFTTAGGSVANYIAKWNGSSWSALGSGMDRGVFALSVLGSDLYAGGNFTTAGGSAANYIAQWNGTSWSPLGAGLNGGVGALAVSGTDLYVGGSFTTAGGIAGNKVAKWDGSGWSALGSGMGAANYPYVEALAVSGSNLYAGGYFTTAGGIAANSIAKWDGRNWSALGSGMGGNCVLAGCFPRVSALAVSGTDLYAGGMFTTAGGAPANNIAKWDGSAWSALGLGLRGGDISGPAVHALAASGTDLYVGGDFTTAGGKVSAHLAKADLSGGARPKLTLTRTSGNRLLVLWPSSFSNFTLQQNLDLNTTNWRTPSVSVNSITSINYIIVDPRQGNQFYRLFKP